MRIQTAVLVFCVAVKCSGQTPWTVPALQELGRSDSLSVGKLRLSAEETRVLKRETQRLATGCDSYPGSVDRRATKEIFESLRVGRVMLTTKGQNALAVQGPACACSPTGNCPFWLLTDGPKPRLLLRANAVQTFAVLQSSANDHFDVMLGQHGSATETGLRRFRFDGAGYKRSDCATVEWVDQAGQPSKSSRLTPAKCH
jgi:hypothetical protein